MLATLERERNAALRPHELSGADTIVHIGLAC